MNRFLFKDKLKLGRHLNGLNQKELSNIIGVKQAYISQIESGKSLPSPKVTNQIARVLNLDERDIADLVIFEKVAVYKDNLTKSYLEELSRHRQNDKKRKFI